MKSRCGKGLAMLLSAVMMIGTIFVTDVNYVRAASGDISFNVSSGGTVQWSKDGLSWTPVTGTISASSIGTESCNIYLKATPLEGYKLDDGKDGDNHYTQQIIRYDGEDHFVSDLGNLLDGSFYFTYSSSKEYSVKISFDRESRPGGPGPGSSIAEGNYKVSYTNTTGDDKYVAKLQFRKGDGDSGKVGEEILINGNISETAIPSEATFVEILLEESCRDLLKGCQVNRNNIDDGLRNWGAGIYDFNGAGENSLDIIIEFSNTKNVRWRNPDDPDAAEDEKVHNAHIYLLNSDNPTDKYTSGPLGSQSEAGGGDFNLTIGETYYFLLVPDYGYQIATIKINGIIDLVPMDATGVFKFEMQNSNLHFQGIVTRADDQVNVSGSNVTAASIENGDRAATSGNVRMTVGDQSLDSSAASVAESAGATNVTAVSSVDISLKQITSKGNGQYWESANITAPSGAVDISLSIPASGLSEGQTYSIVREHNGSRKLLSDATYNSTTGKLSFPSDKFSTYTIVKIDGTPETDPVHKPEPSTSSSSSSSDSKSEEEVAPVVAKPTTLGTVVGGTTVRNWDDLEKVMATKTVATAKTKAEKTAAKAPLVLVLNQRNATVPVSTIQALQKSDASSLHLMLGNGAAITISNGAGLKNQGAINLTNKVTQTKNSKTITFNANTKLLTLGALHMSVPKNVTEAKLYYVLNRQSVYLGTFKPVNGQVFFPINQLGTYQLVY